MTSPLGSTGREGGAPRQTVTVLRTIAVLVAGAALLYHALVLAWVFFGGGAHLDLGWLEIYAVTATQPLLWFLATFLVMLLLLRKAREALVFCAALLVSALGVEVALRVTDVPVSRPALAISWYRPADGLGHALVPGFEGLGPLKVPLRINTHGFRDVERTWEKRAGTVRILGLGDSFTFGWGVRPDETYVCLLERMLTHATARSVEVINAAVPGWGLNNYYMYLRRSGVRYAPDVVVIGYFLDDLAGPPRDTIAPDVNFAQRTTQDEGWLRRVRLRNVARWVDDQLWERNRRREALYLLNIESRRREWAKRVSSLMVQPDPHTEAVHTQALDQHLARLKAVADDVGASLVMMYIPDVSQLGQPAFQHINRVLASRARRQDIPLLDMTSRFESATDVGTYYLWPRDAHTNSRGHAEMGQALADFLCRQPGVLRVPCSLPRSAAAGRS